MKVGILLGSFNPIHMGHLHMAASALNAELVDEVVFVPSVQNPWKKKYSADFRNRCFMIIHCRLINSLIIFNSNRFCFCLI